MSMMYNGTYDNTAQVPLPTYEHVVLDVELVHQMMAGFTEELKKSRQLLILPVSTNWRH